jgi:hypothetical protein
MTCLKVTSFLNLATVAGRVLEHAAQPQAVQPPQHQLVEEEPQQQVVPEPEPAAAEPAEEAPAPVGRRSSTGNLAKQQAVQVNKWGFAPGGEDTLDINLELHGELG